MTIGINWRHPFWRYALYAVIGIALVAGAWFLIGRLFPSNPPGPTDSERRSDSLAITKPIDQAAIDSANARIKARAPASAAAEAAARTAQERADRNGHLADSLAVVAAHAADSARAWHAAYDQRTLEATDLRGTIASNAIVITNLRADTTDLRFQLGVVNKRLKTTEDVNAGLRKDLDQARQCKIARVLNCPSRIQTMVLTGVLYFAGDRYQRSKDN